LLWRFGKPYKRDNQGVGDYFDHPPHPRFRLSGKNHLNKDGSVFEVVLVDVAESPVERPKKSSG